MTAWVLVLVVTNPFGFVSQVERSRSFPTLEACNDAGIEARGRPALAPPRQWERWAGDRVDWVCIPNDKGGDE